MSRDRSHLVPSQTVDKNGVITTRYRKPAKALSKPMTLPVIKQEDPAASLDLLLKLAKAPSLDYISPQALKHMDEQDKTATRLLISLLTTGSEDTQTAVHGAIARAIASLVTWHGSSVYTQRWEDHSKRSWSQKIKHRAMGAWHASSVVEETVPHPDVQDLNNDVQILDEFLHPLSTDGDRSDVAGYWRGLAAAALSKVEVSETNRRDAFTFPVWAGEHEDIAGVINVASERQTLNVEAIAGILDEQKHSVSALRQGSL